MPPVVVTGRGRPHELALLAFTAGLGAAFVVGAKPPATLEQQMPGWILWLWYLLLLISGTTGMVGVVLRHPFRALVLERAAMVGQAAAFAMYGVAIVGYGQAAGLTAAVLCAALATASVWRWVQVGREIRSLRQAGESS